ncbi:MAG: alpha-ketoglutarate-dependent dioxygenase AlkB [Nonlabens sp.]
MMKDLELPDATVNIWSGFIEERKAWRLYHEILEETPWRQNKIKVYGKEYDEPRLTQLYGNKPYSYSGITFNSEPWTALLLELKTQIETASGQEFNVCLINLYRNGADSNGWHADNEKVLGRNPAIASLSLGADRFFHLKHRNNKSWRFKFPLTHGSLLLMTGNTQHSYVHQIAKTKREVEPRINLTFRKINT